jgi:hypothetical protein
VRTLFALLLWAAAAAAQTASTPNKIPTDADLLVAFDRASTTLSAGIDASTLTIPVASGAVFPLTGPQATIVTIESEQIKICSRTGNTLTACANGRGFAGTSAATHLSGRDVRGLVGAYFHARTREELQALAAHVADNRAYNFTAVAGVEFTGFLPAAGVQTVTFSAPWTCPRGLDASNANQKIRLTDGVSSDTPTITGGSCTSEATGTLEFTTAVTFSGPVTMTSATCGIQEYLGQLGYNGGLLPVAAQDCTMYAGVYVNGNNVNIVGKGNGASTLRFNVPNGTSAFTLRDGAAWFRLESVAILGAMSGSEPVNSSGWVLTQDDSNPNPAVDGNTYSNVANVYVEGWPNGFDIRNWNLGKLENIDVRQTRAATGVALFITGRNTNGLTVKNFKTDKASGTEPLAGIWVREADEFVVENSFVYRSGYCLLLAPDGADSAIGSATVLNTKLDNCGKNSVAVAPKNSGIVIRATLDHIWASSADEQCVLVRPESSGLVQALTVVNTTAMRCAGNGVEVDATTGGVVKYLDIRDNIVSQNGGTANVYLNAGTAVTVTGNRIGDAGEITGLATEPNYGLFVNTGVLKLHEAGNRYAGTYGIQAYSDNSTDVNKSVQGDTTTACADAYVSANTLNLQYLYAPCYRVFGAGPVRNILGGFNGRRVSLIWQDAAPQGYATGTGAGMVAGNMATVQYGLSSCQFAVDRWYCDGQAAPEARDSDAFYAEDYNWSQQISLAVAGAGTYTLNLAPCPRAIYGTHTFAGGKPHEVGLFHVASSTPVRGEVNGGTCDATKAAAGDSGTITVAIAATHTLSGTWIALSATHGTQEAWYASADADLTKAADIRMPPRTMFWYGTLYLPLRDAVEAYYPTSSAAFRLSGSGADVTQIITFLQPTPEYANKGSCTAVAPTYTNDPEAVACAGQAVITVLGAANKSEPGPILEGFSIDNWYQYAGEDAGGYYTSADRTKFTKVNGIYLAGVARSVVRDIGLYRLWNGIDLRAKVGVGNAGGTTVHNIRLSTFNIGVWIDAAVDSVRISQVHHWPFRLAVEANALFNTATHYHRNAFYSLRNYGLLVGRADGLTVSDSFFHAGGGIRFLDLMARENISAGAQANDPFNAIGYQPTTALLTNVGMDSGSAIVNGGATLQINGGFIAQLKAAAPGLRCSYDPTSATYQLPAPTDPDWQDDHDWTLGDLDGTGCWTGELSYTIASIPAYTGAADMTLVLTQTPYFEEGDIISVTVPETSLARGMNGTWEVGAVNQGTKTVTLKNSKSRTAWSAEAPAAAGGFAGWRRTGLLAFGGNTQVNGVDLKQGVMPEVWTRSFDNGIDTLTGVVQLDPTIAVRQTSLSVTASQFSAETSDQAVVFARMNYGHEEVFAPLSWNSPRSANLSITGTKFAKVPSSGYAWPMVQVRHAWEDSAVNGTVNTSAAGGRYVVTWVSGAKFSLGLYQKPLAERTIVINGVTYTVADVRSDTQLLLTSTAGTQTGVAYSGTTRSFKQLNTVITGNSLLTPADAGCTDAYCNWLDLTHPGAPGTTHIIGDNLLNGWKTYMGFMSTIGERSQAQPVAFQDAFGNVHQPTYTREQLMDSASAPRTFFNRFGSPIWCTDCGANVVTGKCTAAGSGALAVLKSDGLDNNFFYCLEPQKAAIPTSCAGPLPTGTIWSDGGTLKLCP